MGTMRQWILLVLILCATASDVSCEVIYIVASQDTHCPWELSGELCLTLQQYASNPSHSSNVTLEIQPGNHSLVSELSISNVEHFIIRATNATIACSSTSVGISVTLTGNIHITGVYFDRCGTITMDTIINVHVSYVSFAMCGTMTVNSINNTIIEDVLFNNSNGDVVFQMVQKLNISNTSFFSNIYYYPSGITISDIGELKASGIVLQQKYKSEHDYYTWDPHIYVAISRVSVSVIKDSNFIMSTIALEVVEHCSIVGSMFSNGTNGGYHSESGALKSESSTVAVKNCTFTDNHRRAIYAFDSNITIHQSIFSYNSAGAVYNYQSSRLYSHRHHYDPQTASLLATNCTFVNNGAFGVNGGAIYSANAHITVTNSSFENNRAERGSSRPGSGSGGGIHTIASDSHIHLTRNTFRNNTAENGGAVYIRSNRTSISLNNVTFTDNVAGSNGGAVYLNVTNQSLVSIYRNNFINNTAAIGGGAIYSGATGIDTPITISLVESTFHDNSAAFCGVLDAENHHDSITITHSIFASNRAVAQLIGGGVACIRNASVSVTSSTFTSNRAELHAGVFYVDESVVLVKDSLFTDNSAAEDGGVFYTYVYPTTYIIRGSIFQSNTAGSDGGVMFVGRRGSVAEISTSILNSNGATDRGGAIAIARSTVMIRETNIYNNTAELGEVISACSSNITISSDDGLIARSDPNYPFCVLYDGNVDRYNINSTFNSTDHTHQTTTDKIKAITVTGVPTRENPTTNNPPSESPTSELSSSNALGSGSTAATTDLEISAASKSGKASSNHVTTLDAVHTCVTAILVVTVVAMLTKMIYDAIKKTRSKAIQQERGSSYRSLAENEYAETHSMEKVHLNLDDDV